MIERRIMAARFPTVKSLDSFDFTALPSLNKALVMELARSEYVERRENVKASCQVDDSSCRYGSVRSAHSEREVREKAAELGTAVR